MKILIVRMYADFLNIKNYNCQEIGLAKALIRKGNVCDIVLYTESKFYEEDIIFDESKKIHIYYLPAKRILKNAFFDLKLYDITSNYDIIQTAEYDQIGNVKLRRKVNNHMVIYHGPYLSEYTKGYSKKCIISDLYYLFNPKYKNTLCISKSNLATELLNTKGFKNVTTVGVGLDAERFQKYIESSEKIKELIKIKQDNKLKFLLYIGKIEDRRNIMFLFDILKNVSEKDKNIRLILVGKGNKDYVNKCFEYAKEKNIFDKIIYIESMPQQELPTLYKCCDIFLLPTQYEIFGMVLLEAMYFGLPPVTTLNGGSITLINHLENGFICDLNDINSWTNVILELLYNENKRMEISQKASQKIKECFMWEKLADKFIDVYNKVLNSES